MSKKFKNDVVEGLKVKVSFAGGKKKVTPKYVGKYGQGYDGCGTHTHK